MNVRPIVGRARSLVALPAGAILLSLLVGAAVMLVSSPLVTGQFDPSLPFRTYAAIIEGSLLSVNALIDTVVAATPLIIVYRVSLFNYLIARRLVKIDKIGLVNILLGEETCPEFVQVNAKSKSIAKTAIGLLEDEQERDSMVSKFSSLREMLAGPGGCRRVAEISEQLINSS